MNVKDEPKISVIMPVYNAAEYLKQTLDSLRAQTMGDYEVICVDDGSSDHSREILQRIADADQRFVILTQEHQYAGAARNLGISRARGKYLIFLDADDLFFPVMLEKALTAAEAANAQICVFRAEGFDHASGKTFSLPHTCNPNAKQQGVFSRKDDPDGIFAFTSPAPWNKLIERAFVLENDLGFQNNRSANDLAFVMTALAAADRITALPTVLLKYRTRNIASLQGSQEKDPQAFYQALLELRHRLRERKLYAELERAYLNLAAANVFYNLHSIKNPESFETLFFDVKNTMLGELGLMDCPKGTIFVEPERRLEERIQEISKGGLLNYLTVFQDMPHDLRVAGAEHLDRHELERILLTRMRSKLKR